METSVMRAEKDNSLVSNGNSNNNVCSGCTLPIIDPCLSKVLGKLWHDRCLRCAECQVVLRDKCFARDSNLYCKQDFYKIYGVQCGGCNGGLVPQDLVRRIGNKFFHMTCLKCFRCHKEIATGDQLYILEDGAFLCKSDYDNQMTKNKLKLSLNTSSKVETDSDGEEEQSTLVPFPIGGGVVTEQTGSDEDDEPNRRRGPRTTIKAKQLDVLKAAFLATPKPSKHVREQLAKDTGLTMRVIQVWFQNRRSKERRVKQLPPQEPGRGGRKVGVSEEANDNSYQMFSNPVYPQQSAPPQQPQHSTTPAPPAASIQTIEGWFGQQHGYGFLSNRLNGNSSGSKSDTTGNHNNNYVSNTSVNVNNSLRNTNTPTSTNISTDSNHNECKITPANSNININAAITANDSENDICNNYSNTADVSRKSTIQDRSINNSNNQNNVNQENNLNDFLQNTSSSNILPKVNSNGSLCKTTNGNSSRMNIDKSNNYNSIKYNSNGNNKNSNKEKANDWNGRVDKCILADEEASSRMMKQDNLLPETYAQTPIYPQKQTPSIMQGLKVLATGE